MTTKAAVLVFGVLAWFTETLRHYATVNYEGRKEMWAKWAEFCEAQTPALDPLKTDPGKTAVGIKRNGEPAYPHAGALPPEASKSPWVHQRYAPRVPAGTDPLPSFATLYKSACEQGMVEACVVPAYTLRDGTIIPGSKRVPTFTDAVRSGLLAEQVRQAPAYGGYILAPSADVPERAVKGVKVTGKDSILRAMGR